MRKGEETISGYILVIGTLLLVSITVILAQNYLGGINLPERQEQIINRSEDAEEKIALLAERCWRNSDSGKSRRPDDCFHVQLKGQKGEIMRGRVEENLEELPIDNFKMSESIGTDRKEFFISYVPSNGQEPKIMVTY